MFPVPASDKINIETEITCSSSAHILITDLFGKTVYSENILPHDEKIRKTISVADFPQGMYLITMKSGSISRFAKMIVNH